MGDLKSQVISALREASDIPAILRAMAASAVMVSVRTFDESYIEFLMTQIKLEPRGPQWTEVMKRRIKLLEPYCDCPLIDAHVLAGENITFWIKVDPETERLVFWEQQEADNGE